MHGKHSFSPLELLTKTPGNLVELLLRHLYSLCEKNIGIENRESLG